MTSSASNEFNLSVLPASHLYVCPQRRTAKNLAFSEIVDEALLTGKSPFNAVKLPKATKGSKPLWPQENLVRILTGDVKPEWLQGLGRINSDGKFSKEYKDVFCSSIEEYRKKDIDLTHDLNQPPEILALALDLKEEDLAKMKTHGAWMIEVHPGSLIAIPTRRKNEWNPEFIEGGLTKSGQREWVTPNRLLNDPKNIKIYKIDPKGETIEWKFFQKKLMPIDQWNRAIKNYVEKISMKALIEG